MKAAPESHRRSPLSSRWRRNKTDNAKAGEICDSRRSIAVQTASLSPNRTEYIAQKPCEKEEQQSRDSLFKFCARVLFIAKRDHEADPRGWKRARNAASETEYIAQKARAQEA
jgi:hypothetical protein